MPKSRKTREQKEIAAQKRQQGGLQYSLSSITNHQTHISEPVTTRANEYAYVTNDIRKTTITMFFLIGLQLLTFILLRNHLIKIPGISY